MIDSRTGRLVVPAIVKFGGLECLAFEWITKTDAVLIVKAKQPHVNYLSVNYSVDIVPIEIGELRCDTCVNRFQFVADGRIFTFPFSPLPGWFAWNPSRLRMADGSNSKEITVKLRCDRCADLLMKYSQEILEAVQ